MNDGFHHTCPTCCILYANDIIVCMLRRGCAWLTFDHSEEAAKALSFGSLSARRSLAYLPLGSAMYIQHSSVSVQDWVSVASCLVDPAHIMQPVYKLRFAQWEVSLPALYHTHFLFANRGPVGLSGESQLKSCKIHAVHAACSDMQRHAFGTPGPAWPPARVLIPAGNFSVVEVIELGPRRVAQVDIWPLQSSKDMTERDLLREDARRVFGVPAISCHQTHLSLSKPCRPKRVNMTS